jgi:SHS2 domain-containing protein
MAEDMAGQKAFEFLEHTADVYVAAYGANLAQAFENAALAMFETMTDAAKVKPKVENVVEVSGNDEGELLYNWLEDLLVKFDVDGMLYSKFEIERLDEKDKAFKLKAKIWGEEFDSSRHPQKVGVKAVTYHKMEIIHQPDSVSVKFILDI